MKLSSISGFFNLFSQVLYKQNSYSLQLKIKHLSSFQQEVILIQHPSLFPPFKGGFILKKMVIKRPIEFCEELQVLQIPKSQENLVKEIEILYKLGVECYEIEFLIHLRIKEEFILKD